MGSGEDDRGEDTCRAAGLGDGGYRRADRNTDGEPVTRIFGEYGERAFRDREAEALASLAQKHRLVIATGRRGARPAAEPGVFFAPAATSHLRVSLPTVRQRTHGDADARCSPCPRTPSRALYDSRAARLRLLGERQWKQTAGRPGRGGRGYPPPDRRSGLPTGKAASGDSA